MKVFGLMMVLAFSSLVFAENDISFICGDHHEIILSVKDNCIAVKASNTNGPGSMAMDTCEIFNHPEISINEGSMAVTYASSGFFCLRPGCSAHKILFTLKKTEDPKEWKLIYLSASKKGYLGYYEDWNYSLPIEYKDLICTLI